MHPPQELSGPTAAPDAMPPIPRRRLGTVLLFSLVAVGAFTATAEPRAAIVMRHGVLASSLADLVLLAISAAGILAAAWYALTAGILLACASTAQRSPGRARRLSALSRRWGAPGLRRLATTGAVIGLLGVGGPALATPVASDDLSWGTAATSSHDAADDADSATDASPGTLPNPDTPTPPETQATPVPKPEAPPTPEMEAAPVPEAEAPPTKQALPNTPTIPKASHDPAAPASPGASTYTVQVGDCLWDIARATLPAGSSDAVIAHEWQRWFQRNRVTIGADPNLIRPGQVLHAPTHA